MATFTTDELINQYTISESSEETACNQCGRPLYINDTAYEFMGEIYCNPHCAKMSVRAAGCDHPETVTNRSTQRTFCKACKKHIPTN